MIWSDIPGWSCPVLLALYDEIAAELRPGQIFVEVGVAYGKSLSYFARQAREGVDILGVDSWRALMGRNNLSREQWVLVQSCGTAYSACQTMLARTSVLHRIELCRGNSVDVARALDFEVDAVFLDGSHEYESVRDDIAAWRARLKPGGLLAGHDINDHYPGVERAVAEALPGYEKRPAVDEGGWGGVWTWRKP